MTDFNWQPLEELPEAMATPHVGDIFNAPAQCRFDFVDGMILWVVHRQCPCGRCGDAVHIMAGIHCSTLMDDHIRIHGQLELESQARRRIWELLRLEAAEPAGRWGVMPIWVFDRRLVTA